MNKAKGLFLNLLLFNVLRPIYAAKRFFSHIFLCFNILRFAAVADSQAEGRGFEPRYPLNLKAVKITYLHGFLQRFFVAKTFVFNIEGCNKTQNKSPKKNSTLENFCESFTKHGASLVSLRCCLIKK